MTVSDELRQRVRQQARERCGYCQVESRYVYAIMEIEHITPTAHGGTDDEDNLWLSCPTCNRFKGTKTHGFDPVMRQLVQLFNPRKQKWEEHFTRADDMAEIIGLTDCGRATVNALQLNFIANLELRRRFVKLGWYPPKD
jgi:hypothetical protein